MRKILEYLARDHHNCDTWRSATEVAVKKDWDVAHRALHSFEAALLAHLMREEQVLASAPSGFSARNSA